MKYLNPLLVLALAAGTLQAAPQCESSHPAGTASTNAAWGSDSYGKPDIVDTAVSAGSFQTLVAAVQAAGLVEALKGDGPFTVFAPTDAAFAKIDKQTLSDLLKPENRATLTAILTYHVVPGKLTAKQVVKQNGANSLNGQRVSFRVTENGAFIDGAQIVQTDIECGNGIIHVVDSVILPSTMDIVETAVKAGQFNTLATALKVAGLVEALKGKGPFTVFAPTDEAFAKLPAGTLEMLVKPENRDKLTAILTYHVVPGRVFSFQAAEAGSAATLQGGQIRFSADHEGNLSVNKSRIVGADIQTSNGVIHVIDSVLLPQ